MVHTADFLLKRISPSPLSGYGNAVNRMRNCIHSLMGFRDYLMDLAFVVISLKFPLAVDLNSHFLRLEGFFFWNLLLLSTPVTVNGRSWTKSKRLIIVLQVLFIMCSALRTWL